jgi:HSP20 family molecular chaperone IbpA
MWSEALSVLDRADRLHRQFFTQAAPGWEPPVDVVESGGELRIHMALPGAAADSITLALDHAGIVVSASRAFPCREYGSYIHRIEIPYGRFERRISLALDELELCGKTLADGVLTLTFRTKKEGA